MLNSQDKSILHHKDVNKVEEHSRQKYLSSASHKNLNLNRSAHHFTKQDNSHSSNQKSSISICKRSTHFCGVNRHAPNNGANSNVSYAQLQIILQSVQTIKANATSDIQQLEKINLKHQNKIKDLQYRVSRYQNIETTISSEKQIITLQFRQQNATKQNQIDSLNNKIQLLEDNIVSINSKVTDLNQSILQKNQQLNQANNQKQLLKQRLQYMTNKLKIESDRQIQLIQQRYGGLPNILQHITKLQTKMEQQQKHMKYVEKSLQQANDQIRNNSKAIQHGNNQLSKSSEEHRLIRQQLKQKQRIIKQTKNQVNQLKNEIQTVKLKRQEEINNLQTKISEQQQKYEEEISILLRKNDELQFSLEKLSHQTNINNQEEKFRQIVDAVCDENEDYENILKRLGYLQKFRSEYYLMVNRVQYLSRMLDE